MNNFRNAREKANMSQKEVAITLGVSAPTVSEWESGKKNPNFDNIKALSNLYNASIDYLLGQSPYPEILAPCDKTVCAKHPISFLTALYHVDTQTISDILGIDGERAKEYIMGAADPDEKQLEILANYFEVDCKALKRDVVPLFPAESVQKKVYESMGRRIAAYKQDGDLTEEDIKSIDDFIQFVKQKRKEMR